MKTGRVDGFDEHVGLGTVRADDGGTYPFHCTAIADGSRTIAVGARVVFAVQPGPGGRWEAGGITPIAGDAS